MTFNSTYGMPNANNMAGMIESILLFFFGILNLLNERHLFSKNNFSFKSSLYRNKKNSFEILFFLCY